MLNLNESLDYAQSSIEAALVEMPPLLLWNRLKPVKRSTSIEHGRVNHLHGLTCTQKSRGI